MKRQLGTLFTAILCLATIAACTSTPPPAAPTQCDKPKATCDAPKAAITENTPIIYRENAQAPKTDSVKCEIKIATLFFSNTIRIPDLRSGNSEFEETPPQDNVLWYNNRGEWSPIDMSPSNKSSHIDYEGPQTLILYINEGPSQNNHLREACRMDVPKDATEMLAVLTSTERCLKLVDFNVSPNLFPENRVAVLNISDVDINVGIDDEKLAVAPEQCAVYSKDAKGVKSLNIAIETESDGETYKAYENRIYMSPKSRNIIIIYNTSDKTPPKFGLQTMSL